MKNFLCSLVVAFSMYTRLPMPKVEWNDKTMAYAMGFFPLCGAIEGIFLFFLWKLLTWIGASSLLTGALCAVLPILYTGGIHLDGYCDTVDALSSHQSKERKLEILKDSRSGAFAVMDCGALLLIKLGVWAQLTEASINIVGAVCTGMVISRTLSACSVLTFPKAREGLAQTFSMTARQKTSLAFACLWGLGAFALAFWMEAKLACLLLLAALAVFFFYRRMAMREFGGITGDLAGWFLEICEAVMGLTTALYFLIER